MSENENQHADFELQLDLSGEDIKAWGGESGPRLDPGTYDFEITAAASGTSKAQNAKIDVEFTVINEGPDFGTSFKKAYSLQPKALGRIKQLLMACGARLDAIRSSELIGKHIVGEITHVQGQDQPQADGTMKPGGTFMDITNERAPEGAEQQAAPAPTPPAPTPPPATTKTAAVRRAVGNSVKA